MSRIAVDAEAQAIAYHDGMYVLEGRPVAHKEEPLLLLLHWADMWTASVRERERKKIKINLLFDTIIK